LAGDLTVINDELADSLTAIIGSRNEPEQFARAGCHCAWASARAADTDGFEDPEDVPITQPKFRSIQASLQKLHFDNSIPKEVRRRRILEASVRAPESWHQNAISTAYSADTKTGS
jgi:hypothetical protein